MKCVNFKFCRNKPCVCHRVNHFRIEIPQSVEDLNSRLSRRFRYNLRHEKKLLTEAVGAITFEEYNVQNFPDDLMTEYFRLKKITHNRDYHMTAQEYIDCYHVSNAYVLRKIDDGQIISMVLSCEQCPTAYIENITYDTAYAKYSPGIMVYTYFLEALIRKKYPEVFLMGGKLEYKRYYGSIEDNLYTGKIYRSIWKRWVYYVYTMLKEAISPKFKKKIKALLNR